MNDASDRISAGELRALGVPISETVPDCATVERSAVHFHSKVAGATNDTLHLDVAVSFTRPFEWVTLAAMITKEPSP